MRAPARSPGDRRGHRLRRAAIAALALLLSGAAGPGGDVAPPDEVRKPATAGEVVFPHRLHADDLGIGCADCHHETNAAALDIPHPEYFADFWLRCETCHRAPAPAAAPRACGECHHGRPADVADETLSAKVVIHQSCWSCHEAGTGSEASASCAFCHQAPATAGSASRGKDGESWTEGSS